MSVFFRAAGSGTVLVVSTERDNTKVEERDRNEKAEAAILKSLAAHGETSSAARTRLLVLLSAWWTLSRMEESGTSFEEFIALALDRDERTRVHWGDLTARLHVLVTDELGHWPEAVLSPETQAFIERIVATMTREGSK